MIRVIRKRIMFVGAMISSVSLLLLLRLVVSIYAGYELGQLAAGAKTCAAAGPRRFAKDETTKRCDKVNGVGTVRLSPGAKYERAWGEAVRRYASAVAFMPLEGAIEFSCLRSFPLDALPEAEARDISKILDIYAPALEMVEMGAAIDYRRPIAQSDTGAPLLDDRRRGLLGWFSVLSLMKARVQTYMDEGEFEKAVKSSLAALRFLDYPLKQRDLQDERIRQRTLVAFCDALIQCSMSSRLRPAICLRSQKVLDTIDIWSSVARARQGSVYKDIRRLFEGGADNGKGFAAQLGIWISRPWTALKEADYLRHMSAFARKLGEVEKMAVKGLKWGPAMDESARGFYIRGYLSGTTRAVIAIDLAMHHLAYASVKPVTFHKPKPGAGSRSAAPATAGFAERAGRNIPGLVRSRVLSGHRTDPYTGLHYRIKINSDRFSVYSAGPDCVDNDGEPGADLLFPLSRARRFEK